MAFQRSLLEVRGHTVVVYERSYDEIRRWRFGKLTSFFSALYNRRSVREIRQIIQQEHPDVAIVHNLFPVISPAVLPVLHRAGVRVLMTLHNYRLVCPTGVFYTQGEVCERCGYCTGRELNCLARKCEGSWAGSAAYTLRGRWARFRGYYSRNVDGFMALSAFQRDILARYTGIPTSRFAVIPNCIASASMPAATLLHRGEYIAFSGRLSREKGVDLLFETARRLPDVRFRVAGTPADGYDLGSVPANVELLGFLDREQLADFYAGARALVITSRWYEGFPLSVIEAMYYSCPVIVPELAGMPEIVGHGSCGMLYAPSSADDLTAKISLLASDAALAAGLGRKGYERVRSSYNPDTYYRLLIQNVR